MRTRVLQVPQPIYREFSLVWHPRSCLMSNPIEVEKKKKKTCIRRLMPTCSGNLLCVRYHAARESFLDTWSCMKTPKKVRLVCRLPSTSTTAGQAT